jgi:hypothetical protein
MLATFIVDPGSDTQLSQNCRKRGASCIAAAGTSNPHATTDENRSSHAALALLDAAAPDFAPPQPSGAAATSRGIDAVTARIRLPVAMRLWLSIGSEL